jgi:hypothetical protein
MLSGMMDVQHRGVACFVRAGRGRSHQAGDGAATVLDKGCGEGGSSAGRRPSGDDLSLRQAQTRAAMIGVG